jgi:Dolichyl-phosphate-mannose-protein mannosyltransferase
VKRPLVPVIIFLFAYFIVILSVIHFSNLRPDEYSIKSLDIVHNWKISKNSSYKLVPHQTIKDSVLPYLSHPPLAYYALYGFNRVFGFSSYYVLSGILVIVSAFFVYLTICLLTLKRAQRESSLYAWLGMLIYLFSYPILKFQFFNFHPDIFVLPFLIIAQYLFLKLLMKERYRSAKYLTLIAIFLALMSYSSWFGAVFNFIIILIALFNLRKGYKLVPYIILASFITISVSLLIYGQYALYGGWKNIIYYFKDTYWRESPFYGQLRQSGLHIFVQLMKNLGVFLICLAWFIVQSFMTKKGKFLFTKNGYRYLVLSLFPVLIYSVLLIHYFQNTFASLYFTAPLVVVMIIWLEKMYKLVENKTAVLKIVSLIILSNLSLFLFF